MSRGIATNHASARLRGAATLGWLVALLALAVAGGLRQGLAERLTQGLPREQSDEEREAVNSSPLGVMLGEMRAGMADLMWVKTERYLHRGVAFRPHINTAELARSGQAVSTTAAPQPPAAAAQGHVHDEHCDHDEHAAAADHDDHDVDDDHHDHDGHNTHDADHDHEDHDCANETPLVPTEAQDWRGLTGELHRAIKPWQQAGAPHEHTAGEELLPWYRLMTLSDPHHWRAYMVGTWWLAQEKEHDPRAMERAQEFIAEGIRNNPRQFQLHLVEGRLWLQRDQPRPALASFEQAVDSGLRTRPALGAEGPRWRADDEEDFKLALRYIPLLLARKLNDLPQARRAVQAALRLAPQDQALRRLGAELLGAAAPAPATPAGPGSSSAPPRAGAAG